MNNYWHPMALDALSLISAAASLHAARQPLQVSAEARFRWACEESLKPVIFAIEAAKGREWLLPKQERKQAWRDRAYAERFYQRIVFRLSENAKYWAEEAR
jgi:hypothetical protein